MGKHGIDGHEFDNHAHALIDPRIVDKARIQNLNLWCRDSSKLYVFLEEAMN